MKNTLIILFLLFTFSCSSQDPTQFSEDALNETFLDLKDNPVALKTILESHKGKTIVIDVWASWCSDCIKGMPKVKALQAEFPEAVYLFLSLDKKTKNWKKGIKKYNVVGEHYYINSGWKGDFATFLDLDWIPRYLVIDKNSNIKLFKAITAGDNNLLQALKK